MSCQLLASIKWLFPKIIAYTVLVFLSTKQGGNGWCLNALIDYSKGKQVRGADLLNSCMQIIKPQIALENASGN
jgi:hypothetical protein